MADYDLSTTTTTTTITPSSLVTESHVSEALKRDKGRDAHMTLWMVQDFTKQGDNYGCYVTSVRVYYTLANHHSHVDYIVKTNACRSDDLHVARAMFHKEVNFYAILLPQLNSLLAEIGERPLNTPQYFHSSLESEREVLFLQDLRPVGFRTVDRKCRLDSAHTSLVLEELARLHAASHLLLANHDVARTYDFLVKSWSDYTDNGEDPIVSFFQLHLKLACELLEKLNASQSVLTWVKELVPKVKDVLKVQLGSSQYSVACHGDCWSTNLLFRYNQDGDPVDVMLLDFQLMRYTSPATDLNMFVYSSVTEKARRQNLTSLLESYHATFTAIMEAAGKTPIFTRHEFFQEFRDKYLQGVITAMTAIPISMVDYEASEDKRDEGNQTWEEMEQKFEAKILKLADDEALKSRLLSVFDEMMEAGLIPKE